MTSVNVSTGARLHFGLICSEPGSMWNFGGVGVMLRHPAWRLRVTQITANADLIRASEASSQRICKFMECIRSHQKMPFLQIDVLEELSFHTGLGSGTQLGLALSAVAELMTHRRLQEDPFKLAQIVNRAERSAIGTAGFSRGGFLIDHGESNGGHRDRRVDRMQIPDEWRFILVHPVESQGLSGEQERKFFEQRKSMPENLVEDIKQQILQQIVPSLREQHFDSFASSLESYGKLVGEFYAAEQGGVFAHPAMARLVAHLQANNIAGMAQSSWGPLISIPAESPQHAEAIRKLIPNAIDRYTLRVSVSEPFNTGATIQTTADEATLRKYV